MLLVWLVAQYTVLRIKGFYDFLFLTPHNILSTMLTTKKQRKIIVPVMTEYAKLVHPNIPSMSPTANTNQTIALLAFSDIESPPLLSWNAF